jgi:hypothetical protein
MTDGILNQRLKDQLRHQRAGESRIDGEIHTEVVAKTSLHDAQITLEQRQLLLERDLLGIGGAQRAPKQIAELREHRIGAVDVFMHD